MIELLRIGDGSPAGAAEAGRRLIMAGVGLGVQRLCELMYGPNGATDDLAGRLCAMVVATAWSGEPSEPGELGAARGCGTDARSAGTVRADARDVAVRAEPVSSDQAVVADLVGQACAVRGLIAWADLVRQTGRTPDLPIDLHGVLDRLSAKIAGCQDEDGLIAGDPVASAAICWQLGDQPAFRVQVRTAALLQALRRTRTVGSRDAKGRAGAGQHRDDESLLRLAWATAA